MCFIHANKNNFIILPYDVVYYKILKYLSDDDKCKLLETFVVTNKTFIQFTNKPYFDEFINDPSIFAKNGCLQLIEFSNKNNLPLDRYVWK